MTHRPEITAGLQPGSNAADCSPVFLLPFSRAFFLVPGQLLVLFVIKILLFEIYIYLCSQKCGEIWLLATTQKNAKMTLHAWCVHPNF